MIPLPYKLGAGLLLLGIVGAAGYHKGNTAGRAVIQAQYDAFLADQHAKALDQLEAQKASLLQRQEQIAHAERTRVENERILASLRAKPPVRLRCTTASPSADTVPAAAPAASGGPAGAGVVSQGSGTGAEPFDPVADIMRLADRADDLVESCRAAMAKWPK